MTSNPHTDHAAIRAADLALIAATDHNLVCPVTGTARTLLIQQLGSEEAAERHIAAARAVLDEQKAGRR